MTDSPKPQPDKRYDDWRAVYISEIRDRVKHWGDKRKRSNSTVREYKGDLDGALFAPGGQDA
jgi:hypothetical protein